MSTYEPPHTMEAYPRITRHSPSAQPPLRPQAPQPYPPPQGVADGTDCTSPSAVQPPRRHAGPPHRLHGRTKPCSFPSLPSSPARGARSPPPALRAFSSFTAAPARREPTPNAPPPIAALPACPRAGPLHGLPALAPAPSDPPAPVSPNAILNGSPADSTLSATHALPARSTPTPCGPARSLAAGPENRVWITPPESARAQVGPRCRRRQTQRGIRTARRASGRRPARSSARSEPP